MRFHVESAPLGRRARLDFLGVTIVAARRRQPEFLRLLDLEAGWVGACRTSRLGSSQSSEIQRLRAEVEDLKRQNAVLMSRHETVVSLCSVTLALARQAAPRLAIPDLPIQDTLRALRRQ